MSPDEILSDAVPPLNEPSSPPDLSAVGTGSLPPSSPASTSAESATLGWGSEEAQHSGSSSPVLPANEKPATFKRHLVQKGTAAEAQRGLSLPSQPQCQCVTVLQLASPLALE